MAKAISPFNMGDTHFAVGADCPDSMIASGAALSADDFKVWAADRKAKAKADAESDAAVRKARVR